MSAVSLVPLLDSHRVVLCAGCGGVGKTTTCAALGVAAAAMGKRVLCLTIDPAKRLAQSLGLSAFTTEAQTVAPEVFTKAGMSVSGSLTVMMLDTKSTFDALVAKLAPDDDQRRRVLDNVLYHYISTSLAGTQEYMAMEKLYSVKEDSAYDLIILDTPPTSHALDFLDAPERLANAIDSPAVRWFLTAFQDSGRLSFNLLQKSASLVLRGISRVTGGGFLEQVATFLTEMNELFGGWRARAAEVGGALRGPDVAYVLVTTPEPMSIREVLFFARRLTEQGMKANAFVVNRANQLISSLPSRKDLEAALKERGHRDTSDLAGRILKIVAQQKRVAELDRLHLITIEELDDTSVPVVHVPNFPADIHDVSRLLWVVRRLAPGLAP